MKAFFVIVVAAALGAIVWGSVTGMQPAASRVHARAVEVGRAWYAGLPADPAAATEAYLQRVSPETRARNRIFAAIRWRAEHLTSK